MAGITPAEATDAAQPDRSFSFQDSLAVLRRKLPLASEQPDQDGLTEQPDRTARILQLTERISRTAMGAPVIALAHQLTGRDLRLIFPMLTIPRAPEARSGRFHEKLQLIIRERACLSLYHHGWIVFQKTYPCQPVAKALSVLGRILEIKQTSAVPASLPRRTPVKISSSGRSGAPASAGEPERLRLIHELVSPDTRGFHQQLIRATSQTGRTLSQVMTRYQINPDWQLGTALVSQAFLTGLASFIDEGQQAFEQALSQSDEKTQASLLHQLFTQDHLEPYVHNRYYQAVYRRFGSPDSNQQIWTRLRKRDRQIFRQWVIAATIGSHCRNTPEKARFYLRYAGHVKKVENWDINTLVIFFDGFVLADSKLQPLMAMYYDNPQHLSRPLDGIAGHPASLDMKHQQVDDAIRRASRQGVVGLPFDEEGIKLSGIFLDFALQHEKGSAGVLVRQLLGKR